MNLMECNATPLRELHDLSGRQQYLTFMLGGETFGIGILAVKEIIEYGHVTALPTMPAFVHGVINLRGAAVPVVDLSACFGKQGTALGKRTCIVIVELLSNDGARVMGLVVDEVNAVLDIAADDIEPAPMLGAKLRTDFIAGMGKVHGKFVILVCVERVLAFGDREEATTAWVST